jgi:3'(2'), 5'-bisphosphate nucleotidase/inositol polyphosphate 1-phosphatase
MNLVSITAKPEITITKNPYLVSSPLLFFSNKTKSETSIPRVLFSSMSYNKELAAAKKAVSLAARLCQVKSLSLPLPVSFSFLYFFWKLGLFGF